MRRFADHAIAPGLLARFSPLSSSRSSPPPPPNSQESRSDICKIRKSRVSCAVVQKLSFPLSTMDSQPSLHFLHISQSISENYLFKIYKSGEIFTLLSEEI